MVVLVACKNEKDPNKKKGLECLQHFPIITLWELSVAMLCSDLAQNRMQSFPQPKTASHKICLQSTRYTDVRKDGPISFGSGELIIIIRRRRPKCTDHSSH